MVDILGQYTWDHLINPSHHPKINKQHPKSKWYINMFALDIIKTKVVRSWAWRDQLIDQFTGSTSRQTRCLIQGVVWVLAILKECAVMLLLMPNWCLVCLRSIRSCLPSTILFETDITVIKNVLHVIKYIIIYYYYCYYYYYLLQTDILTQILISSYEGCESQIVSYPQLHTLRFGHFYDRFKSCYELLRAIYGLLRVITMYLRITMSNLRTFYEIFTDCYEYITTGVGSGGGGKGGMCPPLFWLGGQWYVCAPPLLTPHFYFPLELYVYITLTNNYLAFFIYQLIILWTISINWHRWLLLNNHTSKYNSFILVLYLRYKNHVSVCPPPPPPPHTLFGTLLRHCMCFVVFCV